MRRGSTRRSALLAPSTSTSPDPKSFVLPARSRQPCSAAARSPLSAPTVADNQVELVVVDATLSPVQQRNLERRWKAKVIDRTGLILEIFGARARTHEGRLQVELAALTYQRSRSSAHGPISNASAAASAFSADRARASSKSTGG